MRNQVTYNRARRIVQVVLNDLYGRKGLGNAMDEIDFDILGIAEEGDEGWVGELVDDLIGKVALAL